MIDSDRPLWLTVPPIKSHDFLLLASETVATEDYGDDTKIGDLVEACSAGNIKYCDADTEKEKPLLVKCLEPALYYVSVPNSSDYAVYCEFHKPRIRFL